tara:strand:+ start:169 stop:1209 length:1041 start_codon:yes stop_codon:yes gene_type:complete
MAPIHPDAAGLDVGSRFHVVAVAADRDVEPVRSFQSFTGDLHALADWLESVGITTVAMESTGVYWVPVFEILESRGFEVLLVNARHVKTVPGRKTDVNDAQWLQQLHHVVTDITGVTGMRIIRAILDGSRDPKGLAKLRDGRCKASVETIEQALQGNYRPEHVLALRHALGLYEFHKAKVAECDEEIEAALRVLNSERAQPEEAIPNVRHARGRNEPAFDVRNALYTFLGADLSQIHGFGPYSVLRLVAECGDDMSKWPTAKHFTSWLSLAPGNKISGGRVLSSKTRRSTNRAAALLRIAAVNIGRTHRHLERSIDDSERGPARPRLSRPRHGSSPCFSTTPCALA